MRDKLIQEIKTADNNIIKAIGNGSKWPMVAYYYGVISKLLKIIGVRKTDDLAPGFTFMKQMCKTMKETEMFQNTRIE